VYKHFYKFQTPVGAVFTGPIKTGPVSQMSSWTMVIGSSSRG